MTISDIVPNVAYVVLARAWRDRERGLVETCRGAVMDEDIVGGIGTREGLAHRFCSFLSLVLL